VAIDADKLQAFTHKDLETAVQLYQHLKNLGNTFEDLINYVGEQTSKEPTGTVQSVVVSFLTREERKHAKKNRGKRR